MEKITNNTHQINISVHLPEIKLEKPSPVPGNSSCTTPGSIACPCVALKEAIEEITRLQAEVAVYKQMLFGQHSEKNVVLGQPTNAVPTDVDTSCDEDSPVDDISKSPVEEQTSHPTPEDEPSSIDQTSQKSDAAKSQSNKRTRGAKPGHKGHGRRIPQGIPVTEIIIPVPEELCHCLICDKLGTPVPFYEESTQIDVVVHVIKYVYKRQKIKLDCDCADGHTRFITAPEPPQAVNKSLFSHHLLAFLIMLKILFAMPLKKICDLFSTQDYKIRQSSITGAFQRLMPFLEPLYKKLGKEMESEKQYNIDETSWKGFYQQEGKDSYLNWMWIFASKKVMLYVLDPSRSSKVLLKWLGHKTAEGSVIICDRWTAYKKLAKDTGIILSFCWADFRRDFLRASMGTSKLEPWTKLWVERIGYIYHLNNIRLNALDDPIAFDRAQGDLEAAVNEFEQSIHQELADPNLLPAQRKVLQSAVKHWSGYVVFVNNPAVPLDNNLSERQLRIVALARKNYYGSGASWSGQLNAICLSIMQTAKLHGLNPEAYLTYYLDVCAKAGGVPDDLEPYLPWNISTEIQEQYGMAGKAEETKNTCAS